MNTFRLESEFSPKGDQRQAFDALTEGVNTGKQHQVLLGVTGSGKTFTMANVIAKVQKPTLVVVHNKTCLLYTSPSPRDRTRSRMPSSA